MYSVYITYTKIYYVFTYHLYVFNVVIIIPFNLHIILNFLTCNEGRYFQRLGMWNELFFFLNIME